MAIAPIGTTYETIELLPGTLELDMTDKDITPPLYIGYYQDQDRTNYSGIYSTEKDPEFVLYTDDTEPELYEPAGIVKFTLGNIDETGTYKQVTKIEVTKEATFTCRVYMKRGETLSTDYFLIKKISESSSGSLSTPPTSTYTMTITMNCDNTVRLADYTILSYSYCNVRVFNDKVDIYTTSFSPEEHNGMSRILNITSANSTFPTFNYFGMTYEDVVIPNAYVGTDSVDVHDIQMILTNNAGESTRTLTKRELDCQVTMNSNHTFSLAINNKESYPLNNIINDINLSIQIETIISM